MCVLILILILLMCINVVYVILLMCNNIINVCNENNINMY